MKELAPVVSAPLSQRHIGPLDGLRALAILLVIPHNVDLFRSHASLIDLPVLAYMHAGWIGVQLFFVLSGFLISGALLDTRDSPHYYRSFFVRRALRILPLYYAVLVAVLLIAPLLVRMPADFTSTAGHQVWLWTFLSNWVEPFVGDVHGFGHFWSLAVEEQFYLLWPFVVIRCNARQLLWVCVALIVIALGIRIGLEFAHARPEVLYQFTFCRMDALAAGGAAAALARMPEALDWLRVRSGAVVIGSIVLLLGAAVSTRAFAMHDPGTQTLGYTVLALGFGLAVIATILPSQGWVRPLMGVLGSRPMGRVARYSYGMYVFHMPLHMFIGTALLTRYFPKITDIVDFGYIVVILVASFVVAALSYELFEKRFLALKARLAPLG